MDYNSLLNNKYPTHPTLTSWRFYLHKLVVESLSGPIYRAHFFFLSTVLPTNFPLIIVNFLLLVRLHDYAGLTWVSYIYNNLRKIRLLNSEKLRAGVVLWRSDVMLIARQILNVVWVLQCIPILACRTTKRNYLYVMVSNLGMISCGFYSTIILPTLFYTPTFAV